ncbi:MAG: dihydrodipicolinate synthase family protein, partial [SAR324 cluster bacterium]|nr:dihydrodipicolinate synthase family protein [SAR324 cluster bacterium]
SDEERDILLDLCLNHVAGRVPVIVTCSHFSSRIACERAKKSEAAGAKMLMLMPPYHGAALKADEKGIYEHFQQISEAVSIPIMIQDAPLSGVSLSVDLLVRMARELDGVSCFKIEMPGTADKLRKLIESGGSAIEGPFDGEESITLMADLDAGATGTMPSAMIPDLIKPVVEHHLAGRRDQAAEQYGKILPLINYENRQCGLRATKALMLEGEVITSDRVRHPMPALPPESRKGLLELAKIQDPVVLRWGK